MTCALSLNLSLAAIVCGGFAVGCSSSSSSAPPAGVGSTGGCGSATVSFQSDVMPIFAATCTASTCHGQADTSPEENLYLGVDGSQGGATNGSSDVATVYAGLVGVKSLEDPSMNLVTADDLANSYLWHKLNGDQNTDAAAVSACTQVLSGADACSDCIPSAPCGAQMPLGSPLDAATICTIQSWIVQGAAND